MVQSVSGIAASVVELGAKKSPADGLFMPSCWAHTSDLCMKEGPRVKGVTFSQSLGDWFHGGNEVPHQLVDDCQGDDPCNAACHC